MFYLEQEEVLPNKGAGVNSTKTKVCKEPDQDFLKAGPSQRSWCVHCVSMENKHERCELCCRWCRGERSVCQRSDRLRRLSSQEEDAQPKPWTGHDQTSRIGTELTGVTPCGLIGPRTTYLARMGSSLCCSDQVRSTRSSCFFWPT